VKAVAESFLLSAFFAFPRAPRGECFFEMFHVEHFSREFPLITKCVLKLARGRATVLQVAIFLALNAMKRSFTNH
jgi:hypothetical protein